CHLLFDSLQELVDHINDFHVKPEKDSGYCCQWEGCARNGRGFNARYKMLIHIRTHTNEKPHHCPTCNKSFSRLENLKIHTRSHTGDQFVHPFVPLTLNCIQSELILQSAIVCKCKTHTGVGQ
ncbi:Zinc finger protein glis2, partial [Ameca splendens]